MVNRRTGFTLVEMAIVLVVFSVLSGGLLMLMQTNRGTVADINQKGIWQSEAVSVFNRVGVDARLAGSASWTNESLQMPASAGQIVYHLDGDAAGRNLVREQGDSRVVLARDVESFTASVEGSLLRVQLAFFRWNGNFRSRSQHATSVVLPRYAATRDAP